MIVKKRNEKADIKVFKEKLFSTMIEKHLNKNPQEKWFTNPEKTALIYITKQPLYVVKEGKNFRVFRRVFYENSIGIFKYSCLIDKNCKENFGEVKETIKLIEFVLEKIEKGVKRFFIVEQEREEIATSIAFAVAKYILEDEHLAEHFDVPFYQIDDEIVEKIRNAYVSELRWQLECSTFSYGKSYYLDFKEHIFNKETNKSFCGKFEANTKFGLGEIPFYEEKYDTFYDYVNAPENSFHFCQICRKAYNKKFKSIYEKLKKIKEE